MQIPDWWIGKKTMERVEANFYSRLGVPSPALFAGPSFQFS